MKGECAAISEMLMVREGREKCSETEECVSEAGEEKERIFG